MNHDVSYLAHLLHLFVITRLAQWSSSCKHTSILNMGIKVDFSASFTLSNICNDARPLSNPVWHIFAKPVWAFTPPSPQLPDRVFSRHSALQACHPHQCEMKKANCPPTKRLGNSSFNLQKASLRTLKSAQCTSIYEQSSPHCGDRFHRSSSCRLRIWLWHFSVISTCLIKVLCADQIPWQFLRWSNFLTGCAPQQLPPVPGGICCWTVNGSKSGRS